MQIFQHNERLSEKQQHKPPLSRGRGRALNHSNGHKSSVHVSASRSASDGTLQFWHRHSRYWRHALQPPRTPEKGPHWDLRHRTPVEKESFIHLHIRNLRNALPPPPRASQRRQIRHFHLNKRSESSASSQTLFLSPKRHSCSHRVIKSPVKYST